MQGIALYRKISVLIAMIIRTLVTIFGCGCKRGVNASLRLGGGTGGEEKKKEEEAHG